MTALGCLMIYPDLEALSEAVARLFVEQTSRAVAARERAVVALAGGSTPRRAYELLAASPWRDRVNWDQVHLFWGDERGVSPEDPRSNYRMVQAAFLRRVPIPPENIHAITAFPAVEMGARVYEAELKAFFGQGPPRFDLVLLGLGEDGHIASLFPGTSALGEERRWVTGVLGPSLEVARVTLTPRVINQAALVAFLVAGASKAHILKEVLAGPDDPSRLPAQLIRPMTGKVLWLVDREAVASLSPGAG